MEQQVAGNEAIVSDAFMQMDAKISRVASLARSFDGTQIAVNGHNLVPYTAAVDSDIKAFKAEFAAMPGHVTAEINGIIAPLNVAITEQRVKSFTYEENIVALESKMVALEIAVTTLSSLTPEPPGLPPTCVVCTPAVPLSSWSHSPPVVSGALGQPGPSGAGDPMGVLRACIGGNNACHCVHVNEVIGRVDKLEAASTPLAAAAASPSDPLQRDSWGHPSCGEQGGQGGAGNSGGGPGGGPG
jgi:hypothetical protein